MTSSAMSISAGALAARGQSGPKKPIRPTFSLFLRLLTTFVYAAMVAGLGYSWLLRQEGHLTAESGLGYALGIAGASVTRSIRPPLFAYSNASSMRPAPLACDGRFDANCICCPIPARAPRVAPAAWRAVPGCSSTRTTNGAPRYPRSLRS